MNSNFVRVALAVVVVALIAVVGFQFLGNSNTGGPTATETPQPTATPTATSEPSTTAWTGIPEGPFLVAGADAPVQVTVSIASPGWSHGSEVDYLFKDDDGLDAPESVGAALIAWGWPAGTGFYVYGDPCQWSTTMPETPATTPDEIAAAFAAQALTDATAPVDVTVGGYAGKAITLHVPMSYHQVPDVPREEEFAACDSSLFGLYQATSESEPSRNVQGPGQIDELWILDVDGSIVILDATYGPAAPANLVEELRTLAESATFE